jgi:hypothetical protein
MASDSRTGVVDFDDPARNMYGCLPCPRCKGEHRASYTSGKDAGYVCCDECGHKEPIIAAEVSDGE